MRNALSLLAVIPAVVLFSFLANAGTGATEQQNLPDTSTIDHAVKHCLDVVHDYHPLDPLDREFFSHFDAFFNPASGRVENNAIYAGDQAPLFQFNKCMASKGYLFQKRPVTPAPEDSLFREEKHR